MTQFMKMRNNIISAAAAFLLFAAAPALTAQDLVILHTNDSHSQIEEVRTGKGAGTGGVHRRAEYFQQVLSQYGKDGLQPGHTVLYGLWRRPRDGGDERPRL